MTPARANPIHLLMALTLAAFALFAAPSAFAQDAETLYAGGWTNVKQKTSGDWAVVKRGESYFIEFGEDFRTRRAPDLKVFLSTEDASTRGNRNALDNAVFIGELQATRGAQSYELPADVDPADYATILIHCEQYTKFWAASPLTPAQ
ncbi:MAG: DM13 domain-containing protein [Pseudomonadota bacterium]